MDKNKYKETKDDLTNNVEDDNDLEITKSKDSINKLKKIKEEEKSKNKEVDLDKEKINKLEEELVKAKDEKLRLLAEMENLRKRLEKEKVESIKFGSINFVRDIISPYDNLSRALESLSEEEKGDKKNKGLINGLVMVQQEIMSILEKNGVKKIIALNKKFDHNFHQAMMEVESDEENGVVVKELQVGYTMHDRLIRPSMVAVSKRKEKNKDKKD